MKFEIYNDKSGQVRWRLKAKNGQIVASSGEHFHSAGNARRSIKAFRAMVDGAEVEVVKGESLPGIVGGREDGQ